MGVPNARTLMQTIVPPVAEPTSQLIPERSFDLSSRERTFRVLVADYQQAIYRLAFDLTGNHHDAEDLSQDVFIKAYRAMDSFRGDSGWYAWLYRIAVNTYLNKQRKKVTKYRQLWADFTHHVPDQGANRTDEEAEAGVRLRHMEQALQKLTPRERSAFVLRHYQDLSVKEVAAVMEVADGTVKSLLFRGVRKLQQSLAFYRDELGLSDT